jgi:tRNA(fMet)-specific endonuclease VapC
MIRYLLDTNIVSEGLKSRPNERVLQRIQNNDGLMATAAIVWHELLFGAVRSPSKQKRHLIEAYLDSVIRPNLPILPYDERAASWHAQERARLSSVGKTPPFADGQIASIACANQLVLVTKNLQDFRAFRDLLLESWAE